MLKTVLTYASNRSANRCVPSCKLVVVRRSNLNVQGQAQLVEACANEEVLNILIVRTSIFDSTSSSFLSRG